MNDFSSHKTLGLAHYLPLDLAFIMQQLWAEGWTGLDWCVMGGRILWLGI
jgi:hypothetical protein